MVESQLKELPIEFLERGKYQPRVQFDEMPLRELATSIKRNGIIQPIFVRPLTKNRYEIIAGERRWRAAQLAGLTIVPCLIKSISDEDAIAATTIENIQRQDLNPIEEAKAYQRMVNEFDYTHEEISTIVGKSRPKISNLIRLLTLDSRAQQVIVEEGLSEGHAKVIAGTPQYQHLSLTMKSIKYRWSVRQLEQYIKQETNVTSAKKRKNPDILRLEQKLSEYFTSDVSIDTDSHVSGHIKIRYGDLDILAGILDKIGVAIDD